MDQVVFFFGTIEPYMVCGTGRGGKEAAISLSLAFRFVLVDFGYLSQSVSIFQITQEGKHFKDVVSARIKKEERGLLAALRANGTRSSSPWSARKSCGVMFGEGSPPGTATLDQAPPQMEKNGRFSKIIWIPTMLTFRN